MILKVFHPKGANVKTSNFQSMSVFLLSSAVHELSALIHFDPVRLSSQIFSNDDLFTHARCLLAQVEPIRCEGKLTEIKLNKSHVFRQMRVRD